MQKDENRTEHTSKTFLQDHYFLTENGRKGHVALQRRGTINTKSKKL